MREPWTLLALGLSALAGCGTGRGGAEPPAASRVAFALADASSPRRPSALGDGTFEAAAGTSAWQAYGLGFTAAAGAGRGGGTAGRLARTPADTQAAGATQTVVLRQDAPRALAFSGWIRTEAVTGLPDRDLSIYLDVRYMTLADDPVRGCDAGAGPCALYGQVTDPQVDPGTHDWQRREGFVVPEYPVKEVAVYLLLRGDHAGTAWFDDLELSELTAEVLAFDGRRVVALPPAAGVALGAPIDLATQDGLTLSLWSRGGAPRALLLDGVDRLDPDHAFAGGLLVHEAGTAAWVAPGGTVTVSGATAVHRASVPDLALELRATYTAEADRIRVRLEATDTSGRDRPLTVSWALPVAIPGASWGEDPRRITPASGAAELSSTTAFWYDALGATGQFSRYPFATVFDGQGGVALGYPVDQPRVARLAYQPRAHLLYLALDVGLTAATTRAPSTASTELVLFRTRHARAEDGFRSALDGFQARHPAHFAGRIPPEREGIWNAFEDLSTIVNGPGESIDDFHFGIHEGAVPDVAFDDAHGILTFRYLTEPGSTWLPLPSSGVDPASYDQVLAYLQGRYAGGTSEERIVAEKTLSSGIFDAAQRYRYQPFTDGPPWCPGPCALFELSPQPGLARPPYALDQAAFAWNAAARAVYDATPGLDGDYLDSFTMSATMLDHRREHLAAAGEPPTWAHDPPYAIGVPVAFSTVEFARQVRRELPAGKFLIANGALLGIPFGADLFDFTGQETDWVAQVGGVWTLVPPDDRDLLYARAMSGRRPYGLLMNTDFSRFTGAMAERYMRICLFYGIYPSMFSADASTHRYFSDPALYGRDRPLFKRYVPLVQAVSKAGWRPLPGAWSSDPAVHLERWGAWPGPLYLTLRNTAAAPAAVTLTLDREALGLGTAAARVRSRLLGAAPVALDGGASTLVIALPAGEVELLELAP